MKPVLRHALIGMGALAAATVFATPAHAASADLELDLKGTTIAVGADEKWGTFTITNHGPGAVSDIGLTVDVSGLVDTKVTFDSDMGECTPEAGVYECLVPGPIDAGESWDYVFTLTRVGDATGDAGEISVAIDAADDTDETNNAKTVDVKLSETGGVDLRAYAWDIYHVADRKAGPEAATEPVLPGAKSFFFGDVSNLGDVDSTALKMSIKLPAGVTFVGSEDDCDYTTGSTSTVCTYTGKSGLVNPGKFARYYFEVQVADDVAGPVVLGGGEFTVEDIVEAPSISARGLGSTKEVITGVIGDVDPSDNSDLFSAYVGKKASEPGEPGGLPVTGDQVALFTGIGAGAVALGALLVLGARRRRQSVTSA